MSPNDPSNPYQVNPYASPADALRADVTGSDETIRREYISHEASVKSVGCLYAFGAIVLVPVGLSLLVTMLSSERVAGQIVQGSWFGVMLAGIYLSLGVFQGCVAVGLRRLSQWARWGAVILSCIGLLFFPFGTLIAGYILYLLLSSKGQVVFSPEYKRVIAATPEIKNRSSTLVLVLLVIVSLVFIGAIFAIGAQQ